MARSSGEFHGRRGRGAGLPFTWSEGYGRSRRLSHSENAGGKFRASRWTARMAPARRRTHRCAELEVFYSLGRQLPSSHECARSRVKAILVGMVFVSMSSGQTVAADQPVPRADKNSRIAHEQLVAKAKQ